MPCKACSLDISFNSNFPLRPLFLCVSKVLLFRPAALGLQLFRCRSLCCRQPRCQHAIRRAGNIVQADLVAELNRRRIATMFAADSNLQVRARLASLFDGSLHQLAHTFLVDGREWIALQNAALNVSRQELADVVTREAV